MFSSEAGVLHCEYFLLLDRQKQRLVIRAKAGKWLEATTKADLQSNGLATMAEMSACICFVFRVKERVRHALVVLECMDMMMLLW